MEIEGKLALKRRDEDLAYKSFQAFGIEPICGFCRRFHRPSCISEKLDDLRMGLHHQRFYDKPLDPSCFDPIVSVSDSISDYVSNLIEHRIALITVAKLFIDISRSRVKPSHVAYVNLNYTWKSRRMYLKVRVGVHRCGEIEAYIYARNFSSREIYPCDLPKIPEDLKHKSKHTIFILLASQLPPSKSEGFKKLVDNSEIWIWETFTAFKLKGCRSRWSGKGVKKVIETELPEDYARNIEFLILNFLRYCVKPFMEMLKTIDPDLYEAKARSVKLWWTHGLDTDSIQSMDRGPPKNPR